MSSLLIAFSAALISQAAAWDPASLFIAPSTVAQPLSIPAEPPTLILAVIGLGLLSAYSSFHKIQLYKRRMAMERAKLLERRWQPKSGQPPKREAA